MDPAQTVLIVVIVFVAAALQAATGVGFGVIGGPILLAILNDSAAIQISIILNLVIATLMLPTVWNDFDRGLMRKLLAGLAIGSPLGLLLFTQVNIMTLKVLAGIFVLFTLLVMLAGNRWSALASGRQSGSGEQLTVGVIAGVMGTSLAMPGPVPAAWMAVKSYGKAVIRATNLVMFVVAYLIALGLQFATTGLSETATHYSLKLAAPTIAGIIAGKFLGERVSESLFRKILVAVLIATVVSLLASLGN